MHVTDFTEGSLSSPVSFRVSVTGHFSKEEREVPRWERAVDTHQTEKLSQESLRGLEVREEVGAPP